jgi:hypothetical protein
MASLLGSCAALLLLAVFARTRHAPRSRRFAWLGMVLVGCCLGSFAMAPFLDARPVVERLGFGILAAAAGLGHACAFNLVPLPHRRTRLRMWLVPLGMWAGGAGSFAILTQHQHAWADIVALAMSLPVLAAWACMPILAKRPSHVQLGERPVPALRFACPRCGTVVDWGRGVWPCTDCGLFLKLDVPADAAALSSKLDDPAGVVRLECPSCGTRRAAGRGRSDCAKCQASLSLHWNMHR